MPHQGGTNHIRLKYILITEHIGFIPNNILNSCEVIPVARPTAAMYKKNIIPLLITKIIPENITNIKILQNCKNTANAPAHQELFNNLCEYITNVDQIRFAQLRELLYDILIYDFDITECAWHLITALKRKGLLCDDDMSAVLINTYRFLQYYNNNYRPIYHLENFVFMLINLIYANRTKMTCTHPNLSEIKV
jgi:hypothetical protein